MSLFNDFLQYFQIENIKKEIAISIIINKGLVLVGNIKLVNFSNEEIKLNIGKEYLIIKGNRLVIKTISLGELVVEGEVKSVEME